MYALCLEHLGAEVVHRYVGQEPSGRNFNELVLDSNSEYRFRVHVASRIACRCPATVLTARA